MTPTAEIFTVAGSPILQLIAKGEFLDCVKSADGTIKFRCTATVIRLTPAALNEWLFAKTNDSKELFKSFEEYEKYIADKEKAINELRKSITKALNIEDRGVKITQNESEIFTITQIVPLE